jgi:hypothetical protein
MPDLRKLMEEARLPQRRVHAWHQPNRERCGKNRLFSSVVVFWHELPFSSLALATKISVGTTLTILSAPTE